jgi:hypothetical protein
MTQTGKLIEVRPSPPMPQPDAVEPSNLMRLSKYQPDPSSTVGAMGKLGNPQKSAILGSTKPKV